MLNLVPDTLLVASHNGRKVVAVAGQVRDWAAYVGPGDWSDDHVAKHGDKISKADARRLFPAWSRNRYRP